MMVVRGKNTKRYNFESKVQEDFLPNDSRSAALRITLLRTTALGTTSKRWIKV